MAPLSGASASSGALFLTNNMRVYANVIPTQPAFWRPCDQHLSYSPKKNLSASSQKLIFLQENKISFKFPIFREMYHCLETWTPRTHGHFVRLGRSVQWRIQSWSQGGFQKWLVKVCASKGETPLIKKNHGQGGGFRATRKPPWIRHCCA